MAYTSIKHILQEAGFYHEVRDEVLSGAVDGSNKSFTTINLRLFEMVNRDDGEVLPSDVIVRVDGTLATVSEIDARRGIITLETAPNEGSVVNADYAYSNVDTDFALVARGQAEEIINGYMNGFDSRFPYAPTIDGDGIPVNNVPDIIQGFCRIYAAGLLLIRDYGYNTDLELTSKDGFRKMELVRTDLQAFQTALAETAPGAEDTIDSPNAGIAAIHTISKGDFAGDICRERPCSDCPEC